MMAFGAQIKLSVDKSNKSQFRGQIQQLVNEATSSNPIKIKSVKIDLSAQQKNQLVNQIQDAMKNSELTLKIAKIDATSAVNNLRKQLTTMMSGLSITGLKEFLGDTAGTDALNRATKASEKLADAQENVRRKAVAANAAIKEINSIQSTLDSANRKLISAGGVEGVEELKVKYRELTSTLQDAKTQESDLRSQTIASASAATNALIQEVNALLEVAAAAREAGDAETQSADEAARALLQLTQINQRRASLERQIETYISNNPKAYNAYKDRFETLRESLVNLSSDAPTARQKLSEIATEFTNITTQAKISDNTGKNFFTTLQEGWKKFGGWSIVTKTMMAAISTFKKMVSAVKEVDAAMTELRKVTDLTDAAYNRFYQNTATRAKMIGATVSDTINATADFARLGYSIEDAAALAEAALIYKNVGDGIENISDATESLISTLKAFYSEADDVTNSANHIIDAFNEVGNNFAISSTGIGEALQRSAAALSAAGNTLEESIGLVTAANNVVQNPQQVGTALKTLSMYLRAAKTEAEEAGIETEGMANSVSELREEILALTGNKLDIQIDDNTFKSTYQIIEELSEIWEELTDISQANLTELIGGKRNANVLSALIKNFKDAQSASKTAMESMGSAARENEKYLDSIAGKVAKMQASFEAFSVSALDGNIIKFFVDLASAVLNAATALSNLHLLVPTITAIATAIRGISTGAKVDSLMSQVNSQIATGSTEEAIVSTATKALSSMSITQQKFAKSQIESAIASGQLNSALGNQILITSGLSASTNGLSVAGTTLKTVVNGVKAAFTSFSGVLLIVELAISAVMMAIDAHNKAIQESIDKANSLIETYSNASAKYNTNTKTLNGLKEQFDELSQGVDKNGKNVSLTSDQYKTYLSIIDQIIDISPEIVSGFDNEGRAVLNYKNALYDAIGVQETFIQNQRAIYLGSGKEIFEGKENEYESIRKEMGRAGQAVGNSLNIDPITSLDVPHLNAWVRAFDMVGIKFNRGYETWSNATGMLSELYEKSDEFIIALRSTGVYTEEEIAKVQSAIYGLASSYTQMRSIEAEQVNYMKEWSREQEWYNDIPTEALTAFANGLQAVNDPIKSYSENIRQAAAYGNEFASYFSSDGAGIISGIVNGLSDGTASIDDFNAALDWMEESWTGNTAVLQAVLSYWKELLPAVNNVGTSFQSTSAKVNTLTDSLKSLKDGYSILDTARKEIADGGEYAGLSYGTVQAIAGMLKDGEKLTDYIQVENGLLMLNESAWEARSEAMLQSDIDEYQDKLSKLLEYERAYNAVFDKNNNQLSSATDEDLEALDAVIEKYGLTITEVREQKEEYISMISILRALRTEATSGDNGALMSLSDVLSTISSASSFLTDMGKDKNNALDMIQAAMNLASKSNSKDWKEFVASFGEDGIEWNADAIREFTDALVDQIPGINELEQLYPGITDYLKDLCTAEQEAAAEAESMSSVLGAISSASSFLSDIDKGDNTALEMVQSAVNLASKVEWKDWTDFIAGFGENGIEWDADAIRDFTDALVDQIPNINELEALYPGITQYLKDMCSAEQEAAQGAMSLSDVLSTISSASSFLTDMGKDKNNALDMIQAAVSLASKGDGKNFADFIGGFSADGGIVWNTDAIREFTDSLVEQDETLQALEEIYPGIIQYVKNLAAAEIEARETVSSIEALGNAISNVKTASSLLTDIKSGNGDFLSILSTIVDIVKSTNGESLENFLGVENGQLIFNTSYIESWVNSIIDSLNATQELKDQLRELAKEATENASAFEKLSSALSGIKSASTFLTDIESQDGNALDMIQSAMSMAQELGQGHEWTDFVEGFDTITGIKWNTDAVREYSDSLVDAALAGTELESTFPGITQWLKDMAAAESEVIDTIPKLYANTKSVIDAGNGIGRNTELTRSSLQSLIDVDVRYAQAIEYVNGNLTINRDKYDELTNSILAETLVEVQAQAQAIILSEEYQNLTSRIGSLNDEEQKRLDSLNAEIMSYGVLANELANATSAYQRFMNSSGDDSKGRYAQAVKALGVITDTLENKKSDIFGKIGRDQFKLAVDFVLGDNVKVNTPEFQKGLALVRRYLTEDAEGVSNFYDDLVSNGIIDAATGAMHTTVSEISQTLGISEEAVRSMLEELERYQEEPFDWAKLDPGAEAEEAKAKIETLQEALQAVDDKVNEVNESDLTIGVDNAVEAAGKVSSALSDILTKLSQIASKSNITLKINTVQTSSTSTGGTGGSLLSKLFGKSAAGGTQGATGGRTLVGEIGREIVVDPKTGTWRTVGNNGPEFVNLTPGSIVLNSAQTASLLGSGRNGQGKAMAFATNVLLSDGGGSSKSSSSKQSTSLLSGIVSKFVNGAKTAINVVGNAVGTFFNTTKEVVDDTVDGIVKAPNTGNKKNSNNGGGKAAEEAVESLKEKYEALNKELEHLIEHQEFLYKVAERGLDYPGMKASLEEQARLYRQIMENSYAAVEEMKQQGMTDTDEDLQDMERAAWSAYESMYDAFDKIRALFTDALNDKIDDIQKGYSNLKNIMDEIANNGGASVDAFQALTEHGLQYLSFLQDADGHYAINTDAIEKMIAAEKEQLAVETALSYLSSLREALGDGQENRIDALVDATQKISDNSWSAVYAQAALLKDMGLSDDQYNQVIFNIQALQNIAGQVITDLSKQTNDALKDQQSALDKILEFTEDLVEAETKDRIKAIEEEVKAYKKIIDLKKESLKVTKDENDYERSVADKVKEIAKIQAQIDQLSLDDSREARAERAKLIEDMANLQADLSDYQSDHAYDAQIEALDKMSEEYEEKRQTEIDALEESISSTEKVYQLALARIRSGWSSLYDDLIRWNTDQGNVINQEITENWNLAGDAVKKYGSYLMALQELRGLDVGGSLAILPKYHDGGIVGNEGQINDKEVLAVLKKNELVVNEKSKKGLYRIIDFQKTLSEKLGAAIGNIGLSGGNFLPAFAMAGIADGRDIGGNQNIVFNPNINVAINHNGSMSDGDAQRYGEEIANSAIDKMYSAFERRGISGIFGTRLKQT